MCNFIEWNGEGNLVHSNGINLNVSWRAYFSLEERINNGRSITVEAHLLDDVTINYNNLPFDQYGIEVSNSTNANINHLSELTLIGGNESFSGQSSRQQTLRFMTNSLVIGECSDINSLEFFIPDLIIGYDSFSTYGNGSIMNRSVINMELNGSNYECSIIGNPLFVGANINNDEAKINFTTRIMVRCSSGNIIYTNAVECIDLMLQIVGFAYGAYRPWVMIRGYRGNQVVYQYIRNARTTYENNFPVIRIEFPQVITNYLQQVYNNFCNMTEDTREEFEKLFEGVSLAGSNLVYPIPFILLGSALESFMNEYLLDNQTSLLTRGQKRSLQPSFINWAVTNIVPLISEDERESFISGLPQSLSQLVYRTLRHKLNALFNSEQLLYDIEYVNNFVRCRNNGVHNSYTYEHGDHENFMRMLSLVHKFILSRLSYSGEYIDWSVSPPAYQCDIPKV